MWNERNNALEGEFKFNNFQEAFGFMQRVAFLAEKQGHHPTFENTFNKVKLILTTHDEGNKVTEKDYKLSKAIDEIRLS